jgi:hypothetical protein
MKKMRRYDIIRDGRKDRPHTLSTIESTLEWKNGGFNENDMQSNDSNYLQAETKKVAKQRAILMNYPYVMKVVFHSEVNGFITRYLPSNYDTISEHNLFRRS